MIEGDIEDDTFSLTPSMMRLGLEQKEDDEMVGVDMLEQSELRRDIHC